jgi:hypothetical protein
LLRSIVRLTGVARNTDYQAGKKSAAARAPVAPLRPEKGKKKRWEALEFDEMWPFVGRRSRELWLWLAVVGCGWLWLAVVGRGTDFVAQRGLGPGVARSCHAHPAPVCVAPPLPPPHAPLYRCLARPPAGTAYRRALRGQERCARGRGAQLQAAPPLWRAGAAFPLV